MVRALLTVAAVPLAKQRRSCNQVCGGCQQPTAVLAVCSCQPKGAGLGRENLHLQPGLAGAVLPDVQHIDHLTDLAKGRKHQSRDPCEAHALIEWMCRIAKHGSLLCFGPLAGADRLVPCQERSYRTHRKRRCRPWTTACS